MSGREICSLGKEDFLRRTPPFMGDILWEHLDMMLKGKLKIFYSFSRDVEHDCLSDCLDVYCLLRSFSSPSVVSEGYSCWLSCLLYCHFHSSFLEMMKQCRLLNSLLGMISIGETVKFVSEGEGPSNNDFSPEMNRLLLFFCQTPNCISLVVCLFKRDWSTLFVFYSTSEETEEEISSITSTEKREI